MLLVEDLTTDGGSKLSFVDAIRETGATCGHTAVIFYYGIFPETIETLANHGVATASSVHVVGRFEGGARGRKAFDDATLDEVETFLRAPRRWQDARRKIILQQIPPYVDLSRVCRRNIMWFRKRPQAVHRISR